MGKLKNLIGKQYGSLTPYRRAKNHTQYDGRQRPAWDCVCFCGKVVKGVLGENLRSGNTISCGCSRIQHGHAWPRTPTYISWSCMKQRCNSEISISYKYYRGRGISYCKEWESFEIFLADMGERPYGMTLDRIDNDKDYSPDNCRWADYVTQAKGRRKRRKHD